MKKLLTLLFLVLSISAMGQNNSKGLEKQYRNIKLEKPNSILSVLPIEMLPTIDSLTIVGFMYETDLKILEECKQLRYLDLSKTYITYSPEKVKEIEANAKYLKSLFRFAGLAADAKYKDKKCLHLIMLMLRALQN